MNKIFNQNNKIPKFNFVGSPDEYIFITSLNLGGAEKIVSDHLWANYWNKRPINYTLIVLYNKDKEHEIPPNVNIIRLNSKIENGTAIFQQIAFRDKVMVCHLLNDVMLDFLFNLNVKVNLVIHNDQQGWSNRPFMFNHKNITGLVGVCHYVTRQIQQYTDKHVLTLRHQINYKKYLFDVDKRNHYRKEFALSEEDIVIGMVGRIAWQKNYSKAIQTIYELIKINSKFKLMIVGGFEKSQSEQYIYLCQLINHYKLHQNVIMTGFRNDIKDLINLFDCSLNTSHFEGLSMASQELMANGLTIFATNTCGQSEILDDFKQMNFYSPSIEEKDLAHIIYKKYQENHFKRILFLENQLNENNKRAWASHRIWNLLPYVRNDKKDKLNVAFLSSNLNLGGAQKSLFNLIKELSYTDNNLKLILANQSNQENLYHKIQQLGCEIFLANDSIDVFDISQNIINYCIQNKINKILFWNVDAKLRLLLTKICHGYINFVDVSPGHYCFEEMHNENNFMQGIYYHIEQYHRDIHQMVFKYQVEEKKIPDYQILKNKVKYISNGVYLDNEETTLNDFKMMTSIKEKINKDYINFVVCGRIAPSKHLDIIFESFLKINYERVKLHIIGSVEPDYEDYFLILEKKYSQFFNQKIIFHGQCDNATFILQSFDALIVLGTHQGCPNIALEALAAQISVIANNSGGTAEIINNKTGILLPEKIDVNHLIHALDYFIQNKDEMYKKAEFGKLFVSEQFSMKKMAHRYIHEVIFEDQ